MSAAIEPHRTDIIHRLKSAALSLARSAARNIARLAGLVAGIASRPRVEPKPLTRAERKKHRKDRVRELRDARKAA